MISAEEVVDYSKKPGTAPSIPQQFLDHGSNEPLDKIYSKGTIEDNSQNTVQSEYKPTESPLRVLNNFYKQVSDVSNVSEQEHQMITMS